MTEPFNQANRLDAPWGILIDRNTPLCFSFEGKAVDGYQGDTIASALIANQQWLMSRSFKYHRPRGPLTMAGQDANTLVQLPSAPNTLADKYLAVNGLRVMGQNYKGSLKYDRLAVNGLFSRFLPVGFYYKAFFRPRGIWDYWVKIIRKQAGLGVIDVDHQAVYRDKQYLFCDVAVVGAGPAGLSAALAAADSGADVILMDENTILGGSSNYSRLSHQQLERVVDIKTRVEAHPRIRVYLNATCNSWHAEHWLAVVTEKRLYKLRAQQLVMATGVFEQQAIFRGNDIPGVIMGSAAQRLLRLYGVKPGQRAVVLAGNDEAYAVALDLLEAGVTVAAVVDLREASLNLLQSEAQTRACQALLSSGVEILRNHSVFEATSKNGHLTQVDVRQIVARGECAPHSRTICCDTLCMSVGYMPVYQLVCQAGGQLSYDDDSARFSLSNIVDGMHLSGSMVGLWNISSVIENGQAIGFAAAGQCANNDESKQSNAQFDVLNLDVLQDVEARGLNHPWPMFLHPKGKEFVDYDEDLHARDILNATRDGYEHIQLVKRYSTCGMGPSQGRHSALAAARLVADITHKTVAETGVTTARPPFASEPLGVNAGRSFYPRKYTSMQPAHEAAKAVFLQADSWYRPAYYTTPKLNEAQTVTRESAIIDEVNHVRSKVGLVDVSTLGGIDVRGPDAGELLNRFYTSTFHKVAVGKSKYALLTNEAGVVIDDGIACRMAEDHFYVTATTGGVDRVFQTMLKWNTLWALDVDIANVTTAWCGVNLAGPLARKVLEKLCDCSLSNSDFPYMGVKEARVAGIPSRVLRVGFVGELGFEIHVPQLYGDALWSALLTAGEPYGIRPFGIEAQRVLRLEKGHVIIGQDTDAMSTPHELQMSWAVAKDKAFFLGARTLTELAERGLDRKLVGFTYDNSLGEIKESHLLLDDSVGVSADSRNATMIGRVTSSAYSPSLGCGIGLAYVTLGKTLEGSTLSIKIDGGRRVVATVVKLPFYDPQLLRQEM